MRNGITAIVAVAALALLAGPASAGTKMAGCDEVTAPGGTLSTSIELTNDTGGPARYRVTVQLHGDRENVAGPQGRIRGKKVKQSFTLAAGEKSLKNIECLVPDGALGPLVVSVTVKGPDGTENYEAGSWAFPDGEMPDPSDPPQDYVEPELTELTGMVYLNEDFFPYPMYGKPAGDVIPGDDPTFGDGWMPPPFETELKLVTAEGDEWHLLGPEAWVLAVLMWKAELTEIDATISGYELDEIPIYYGETNGMMRSNRGSDIAPSNTLLVLSWTSEDVEDPRAKLVEFRPVIEGPTSKVTEYTEYVVQDQAGFDKMLADAGVILPTPPEPTEDPTTWRGGWMGDGNVMGGDPGDGTMPPDWMPDYWYPWEVDFATETVLGVFAGEMPTTGYWIFVNQIVREGDDLVVEYCVIEPDEWTMVIDVLTYPFCVVAIPKTDGQVTFKKVDAPTYYYDVPMPGPGPMMGMR